MGRVDGRCGWGVDGGCGWGVWMEDADGGCGSRVWMEGVDGGSVGSDDRTSLVNRWAVTHLHPTIHGQ